VSNNPGYVTLTLQCCKSDHKFLITYDIGIAESQWKVCEKHFKEEELFQKNIKDKKEIEK
jgi:hypothetical protein